MILAVVKYMSDQLLVMNKGKIEELDDADVIYNTPKKSILKNLFTLFQKDYSMNTFLLNNIFLEI